MLCDKGRIVNIFVIIVIINVCFNVLRVVLILKKKMYVYLLCLVIFEIVYKIEGFDNIDNSMINVDGGKIDGYRIYCLYFVSLK